MPKKLMHLQQSSNPVLRSSFTHFCLLFILKVLIIINLNNPDFCQCQQLILLMNFNDKNDSEPAFVLRTEQNQLLQHDLINSSQPQKQVNIKTKNGANFTSKSTLKRGKENDGINSAQGHNKNAITNHSFNGYFNQNNQKPSRKINQSINKRHELSDITSKNHQLNSPTNFNSTGKLSNLQFINDQSKAYSPQQIMHPQVISLVKEYFPDNFQTQNFSGKYFSVENFVQILFEQFYDLIGGQNGYGLADEFSQKLFMVFGDKIYFEDLFERTLQSGLTGLIFEIVKLINDDRRQGRQLNQHKKHFKNAQKFASKNSFVSKGLQNSGFGGLKNQRNSQVTNISGGSIGNSNFGHRKSENASMDQFFGNSISKVKFYDELSINGQNSQMSQEGVQEVKQILEDYIESMYQEAETKLNKKYIQQMKKITLKYKETEKILEKVNERISNHYDSIQLEKEHQKKIKFFQEKQNELQNKVKKLEYELKSAKDEAEKERLYSYKLEQQTIKLKEKLEKYQNAIFEKAMQKDTTSNISQIPQVNSVMKEMKPANSALSQYHNLYQESTIQEKPQKFQVKIDTITEHRPAQIPVVSTQSTYVPYVSRIVTHGGLTPTRIKELQRTSSVSPLKQRISFVKTQNPTANSRITIINPSQSKPSQNGCDNSRINYSTNKNITTTSQISKDPSQLKISSMVQIGEKVQLRPLSPIGKTNETNVTNTSKLAQNSTLISSQSNQNLYSQKSYSPIKVQFCSSRITTLSTAK